METNRFLHVETLKRVLDERQRENPAYSLRAYARDLGLHSSTLSLILNYKRKLPQKNLAQVLEELDLSPMDETTFKESFFKAKTNLDNIQISAEYYQQRMIDEAHYHIIAEWEYYAVLSLLETKKVIVEASDIATALSIPDKRAEVVLEGLVRAEFIKQESGKWTLTTGPLRTTEDITSKALKKSHHDTLNVAKKKLDEIEIELRDFSSTTVAIDPDKLPEAKAIIREFRQRLASFLGDGNKREVYQFAIQLFPLTTMNNGE